MRRLIFTLLVSVLPLTGLCQGKVTLINDAASLVMFTTEANELRAADAGLAGQPVGNTVILPSGITLVAGLYGGTSSASLFLYSTVLLTDQGTPGGYIPATHVVLIGNATTGAPAIPGIANGTPIGASTPWFQVRVWDSAYASSYAALAAGAYFAQGALFQMNPGPSLAYPLTAPPSANSTWTDAPIVFALIPEPSVFALVAIGGLAGVAFAGKKPRHLQKRRTYRCR